MSLSCYHFNPPPSAAALSLAGLNASAAKTDPASLAAPLAAAAPRVAGFLTSGAGAQDEFLFNLTRVGVRGRLG
jgi:hypothetical protein